MTIFDDAFRRKANRAQQRSDIERQRAIVSSNNGNQLGQLFIDSKGKQKVRLPNGEIRDAVLSGSPGSINATSNLNSTSAYVQNQSIRRRHVDASGAAFVLLNAGGLYYIGKSGNTPMDVYFIDVDTILGSGEADFVFFSQNGRHLFVGQALPNDAQPGGTPFAFALNWSLGQDSFGVNVVKWTGVTRHTVTITLPEPLAPIAPPIPPPYQADPGDIWADYRTAYGAGLIDYITWEAEDDPVALAFVLSQTPAVGYSCFARYVLWDDSDGNPHADVVGNWSVNKATPNTFRVKSCFSLESTLSVGSGWPTFGSLSPGVVPITYGSVDFDITTSQHFRRVQIPAFSAWSSGSPTGYDLDTFFVAGGSHISLPIGNNANGIGNVYNQQIFPFFLNNSQDINAPNTSVNFNVEGNMVPHFGMDASSIPTAFPSTATPYKHWWNQAKLLTPPQTGYFTNFLNKSSGTPQTVGTWTTPGWRYDPFPGVADSLGSLVYRGISFLDGNYANSTINLGSYSWANTVSQAYIFAITGDGATLASTSMRSNTISMGYNQVHSDPTYHGEAAVFNAAHGVGGSNFVFGANQIPGQLAYRSPGGGSIATFKSNQDTMVHSLIFSVDVGPYMYTNDPDYLSITAALTLPPIPNPRIGTINYPQVITEELAIGGVLFAR